MRLALTLASLALFALPARAEVRYTLDCNVVTVGSTTANGVDGPGNYPWMVLSVTNNNGREVPLSLGVFADTDVAGRKYRGSCDPVVKEMVEKRLGKTFKTLDEVRGKIADKESVEVLVTLGKADPNVDTFFVNVTGLVDRVYRDHGKTWVEDRALLITLSRPGDEYERQNDVIKVKGKRWVVLAEAKELRKA